MKRLFLSIIAIVTSLTSFSQIRWDVNTVKYDKRGYQVILTGTLDSSWHIYSMEKNDSCISIPTSVELVKNPLIKFIRQPEESGVKKRQVIDLGMVCKYFEEEINYFWYIQPKHKLARTEQKGTIKYQLCTNEKCLPPTSYSFTIPVPPLNEGFKGYGKKASK